MFPYRGGEGDFDTIDEVENALAEAIELSDEDHELEVRTIAAQFRIEHGNSARGVEHCRRLVDAWTDRHGFDNEGTMVWRGFLGRALTENRVFEEAEEVLGQLVVDRARVLGPDDPQTLVRRGNLDRAVGLWWRHHCRCSCRWDGGERCA